MKEFEITLASDEVMLIISALVTTGAQKRFEDNKELLGRLKALENKLYALYHDPKLDELEVF